MFASPDVSLDVKAVTSVLVRCYPVLRAVLMSSHDTYASTWQLQFPHFVRILATWGLLRGEPCAMVVCSVRVFVARILRLLWVSCDSCPDDDTTATGPTGEEYGNRAVESALRLSVAQCKSIYLRSCADAHYHDAATTGDGSGTPTSSPVDADSLFPHCPMALADFVEALIRVTAHLALRCKETLNTVRVTLSVANWIFDSAYVCAVPLADR